MAKAFYQTTKTVRVVSKEKVVIKAPGVAGPKGDPGTQIITGPGFPSNLIGKVGDLYTDTLSKIVYGPKTSTGWPTGALFEAFNRDLLGQVFTVSLQQVNSEVINNITYGTWNIEHGLGYYPNATCIDSSGRVIEGEVSYPDENTIALRFIGATSGKAYLS
jgi:hypothetical protein